MREKVGTGARVEKVLADKMKTRLSRERLPPSLMGKYPCTTKPQGRPWNEKRGENRYKVTHLGPGGRLRRTNKEGGEWAGRCL